MAATQPTSLGMSMEFLCSLIPNFDGSTPVQDFLDEITEMKNFANWSDLLTVKIAKSKFVGPMADILRNRYDISNAKTFQAFSALLISTLYTSHPVTSRLQALMDCSQQPGESVDAFAFRIRSKFLAIPEYDATMETQKLKDSIAVLSFMKGLRPSLRQPVLVRHPANFEDAVIFARFLELHLETYMDDPQHRAPSPPTDPSPKKNSRKRRRKRRRRGPTPRSLTWSVSRSNGSRRRRRRGTDHPRRRGARHSVTHPGSDWVCSP